MSQRAQRVEAVLLGSVQERGDVVEVVVGEQAVVVGAVVWVDGGVVDVAQWGDEVAGRGWGGVQVDEDGGELLVGVPHVLAGDVTFTIDVPDHVDHGELDALTLTVTLDGVRILHGFNEKGARLLPRPVDHDRRRHHGVGTSRPPFQQCCSRGSPSPRRLEGRVPETSRWPHHRKILREVF